MHTTFCLTIHSSVDREGNAALFHGRLVAPESDLLCRALQRGLNTHNFPLLTQEAGRVLAQGWWGVDALRGGQTNRLVFLVGGQGID